MATKKAGGSSRNGRDSNPKMLGIKRYGGEIINPGTIIIRQRGTQVKPGDNVGMGRDHTIYAKVKGYVKFVCKGARPKKVFANIIPIEGNA